MSVEPVVTSPGDSSRVDAALGLSEAEAAARAAQGLLNITTGRTGRTVGDILRANLLTRFNAILGALLVVVMVLREYRDALFGIVLVTNALIGIVQELRAKATLDRLNVVSAPQVRVVRDGTIVELPPERVVLGDVVEVGAGDQLPVDGVALTAEHLEVDESLLTGESDPQRTEPGARLLSGSFVVAGQGRYVATAVGDAAYAAQLANEAKRFTLARSELRRGTNTILRVGTWVLLPVGTLLVVSQLRSSTSVSDALRSSVAGVGAMVPEGLVLLTSLAFAVSVIRLGRRGALVQELSAVEVLARVDVVCVDKTGTLTEGSLSVTRVEAAGGGPAGPEVLDALGGLAAAEDRPNASLRAVAEVGTDAGWHAEDVMPFSSARKWSGASFRDHGTWLLGAADVLLGAGHPLGERVERLAAEGERVLALARVAGPLAEELPADPEAMALVVIEERLRPEAAGTLAYFAEQGVAVKVISGDHPATAGAIAARVGVPGASEPVDARTLPDDQHELGLVVEASSVFGRVQPHQKQAMVRALQARGHVVAMTGDGVNDVLALKDADMGVAMGSGSGATRAVAQLVLIDDSFAALPAVVAEGRRVIANVERVANLFVTKSVYAALLALAVGIAGLPFPFYPRHLTIISTLTIGIPAFFLALAPNTERSRPGFVRRVTRFALPAGLVAASATFGGYALAGSQPGVLLIEERTTAVIVLFLIGLWVLGLLTRPMNGWKIGLLASMSGAFVVTLATPGIREFFDLRLPSAVMTFAALGVAAIAIALLEAGWQIFDWYRRRQRRDLRG